MRPHYHYAPAANWLSDPNGLIHHGGQWHLFYQYNPQGENWGHMSWGHAVSSDLAEWRELPVAIPEDGQDMIFSGSAVIDSEDRAGFGRDALVAIYTAHAAHGPARQTQALAWSGDGGVTFTKYEGNPVIDLELADFRDPNVFWHSATDRWIMVVVLSAEDRALIYASRDLRQWDQMSVIHGAGAPGHVWECPLLIELPVEGSDQTRWLFKVDVLHDGPGSGAIYQTGTFDGIEFRPDGPAIAPVWQVVDDGRDFYAAIAWHDPRDTAGRPAWIGWIGNHAYQGQLPAKGWRGAMSLPRRLSLVRQGEGYRLRQEVEPAACAGIAEWRGESRISGNALRLEAPAETDWSIAFDDAAGSSLEVIRRGASLRVVRRDQGCPALDSESHAEGIGEDQVTLWLDNGSLEVIANGGIVALTVQHRLGEGKLAVACRKVVAG